MVGQCCFSLSLGYVRISPPTQEFLTMAFNIFYSSLVDGKVFFLAC